MVGSGSKILTLWLIGFMALENRSSLFEFRLPATEVSMGILFVRGKESVDRQAHVIALQLGIKSSQLNVPKAP